MTTTEAKSFASKYQRNEQGWIKFPRDIEYRRTLFPNQKLGSVYDVFNHPAKMNLYLVESLVEYLTEPGDWILDPFGGTGSSALSMKMGRHCTLIDVEKEFGEIIKEACSILVPGGQVIVPPWDDFPTWHYLSSTGQVSLYIGDNRRVLKYLSKVHTPVDCIITSPPYSTALNPGSNPLEVKGREGTLAQYSRSPFNLSQLNPFYWEQALSDVWRGCAGVMKPGGKMAVVNKDIVKSGRRELLSSALIRQAGQCGFKYSEWFKWAPPGTIRQETARNKGGTVIEDEDIIVFERS